VGEVSEDYEDDNQSFSNFWSWYAALETMAGEDITKIPTILEYDLMFVLNHLAYVADLNEIKRNEHQKMMAKYK
jgi:hypothetical protein